MKSSGHISPKYSWYLLFVVWESANATGKQGQKKKTETFIAYYGMNLGNWYVV